MIRLNPDIAAQPDRADEVLYRLRAIPLSVNSDGLVRANEHFAEWLRGEKSMPFGHNGEHVSIRLIDFSHSLQNHCVVTSRWVYPKVEGGRRFDVMLLINGKRRTNPISKVTCFFLNFCSSREGGLQTLPPWLHWESH